VPHFRVDDGLHNHPKARKAGLEAMGLWNVSGSWCMGYLTDGFVPDWYVRGWPKGLTLARRLVEAGFWTPAVKDGEKGWQFHEFTGPGRNDTRAEIEAAREKWRMKKAGQRWESPVVSPGDRPGRGSRENVKTGLKNRDTNDDTTGKTAPISARNARTPNTAGSQSRNGPTSRHIEMSPGDTLGDSPGESLRATRDPTQPNPTKEISGSVSESATEPNARDSVAATPGAELVRELIPDEHPDAVRTLLRIRASELIRNGNTKADVAAGLQLWLTKPSLGPNALPSLVSEAIKLRTTNGAGKPHKMRALAELAQQVRSEEQAELAYSRKELT
jgi:hypothetical protein